jgi:hypothetical protein
MLLRANEIRPLAAKAGIVVRAAALAGLLLHLGMHVEIVMKAAGIPKNATGIGGFVNGAHALITPALVMVAAVAPIGLIAGGVVMMFGGRRGRGARGSGAGRGSCARVRLRPCRIAHRPRDEPPADSPRSSSSDTTPRSPTDRSSPRFRATDRSRPLHRGPQTGSHRVVSRRSGSISLPTARSLPRAASFQPVALRPRRRRSRDGTATGGLSAR